MSVWWVAALLIFVAACTDGDSDEDSFASLPECSSDGGWVSAGSSGGGGALEPDRAMLVAQASGDGVSLEDDLDCDLPREITLGLGPFELTDEAWLPPVGAEVAANYHESWSTSYLEVRARTGELLVEGGVVDGSEERRMRPVDDENGALCRANCFEVTTIRAAVSTDDGEIEMSPGETRSVTIEGENFLAVIVAASRSKMLGACCEDCSGGLTASGFVVRTSPVELPIVTPRGPPMDDCAAEMPEEGDPCTTRGGLSCDYEWGGGCENSYVCNGCFWRLRSRSEPEGLDCGIDPGSCLEEDGTPGGCWEESSCTECPACPAPIGVRWRCVLPGEDCPPCDE